VVIFDALLVGVLAPLLLLASPPVTASAGGPVHVPFASDTGGMTSRLMVATQNEL